jgi:transcriptional regulator with XRE-family HTH domain
MGREEFGQLVDRKRQERGLSQGRLAVRIGELSGGRYLDPTGVRNLIQGRREIDEELFERVIAVLEIDRDEAHAALGWWPEGVTVEEIKELRRDSERRAARMVAVGRVAQPSEGVDLTAPLSSSSESDDLMRSCAPSAGQPLPEAA